MLFALCLLIGSAPAFSQHDHGVGGGHEVNSAPQVYHAPHGGELQLVGKYQIEMVVNPMLKEGKVMFYIFKSDLKEFSSEGITAQAIFKYSDGSTASDTLLPIGENGFASKLDKLGAFHSTVIFSIKKKKVSATFHHDGHYK